MNTIVSRDGCRLAFDQTGTGDPVILLAGAFSYRKYKGLLELSQLLSSGFSVINYDRRGRGDSDDKQPYSVEREIEDLEALVQHAGGSPYVWGLSSGATLALRAASRGVRMRKLAIYEPPFLVDRTGHLPPRDFTARLTTLIRQGRRSHAVRFFLVDGMGAPAVVPWIMRVMPGVWRALTEVAHTLPYDAEILGETIRGVPPDPEQWRQVTVPTLVMYGEKSPAALRNGAKSIAGVLPCATLRALPRESHNVSMKALAPELREFFHA